MRVLVVAVGSRGDMAPYTGLGAGLVAAGHEVTIAAHPPFEPDIRRAGLGFAALGGDVRSLVAAPADGRRPSPMLLARRVDQFTRYLRAAATDAVTAADQGTDVVLYNSSALFGQDIADGLRVPGLGVFTQPIEPTGDFPPILANSARSLGRWGNRLSGTLVRRTLVPFRRASELVRRHYGPRDADRSPTVLHGYSPAVLPRPADWRAGLDVVGYWWPHQDPTWSPPADLVDFLAAGPTPVFLGFGSMAAGQGGWLTDLVRDAVRQAGVRAVVRTGWADVDLTGDGILAIGDVPHSWLFPRMAAVVHHGGAGTTAAALRADRPSVLTPIYADQPLWAARVHALGAGPEPLPLRRVTASALATAIRAAITDDRYAAAARRLADRLAAEDSISPAVPALGSR
ncbi:MAG TPA: glycosyltransferase [Pseudonocardiaceae bacterium]|nr:glycosyltransferase [Pseudonocardiaceae bacterium]